MTNTINLEELARRVQEASGTERLAAEPGSMHLAGQVKTAVEAELYDVCGRRRSPATLRSFRLGVKPANAGRVYPATPPTGEQVMAMLACCPDNPAGRRLRALMVVLYRSGLRVHEGLLLHSSDLDSHAGTITVKRGKGGKYRVVGMDEWAFAQVANWVHERTSRYPDGPLFCIVQGPTKGQPWSTTAVRAGVRQVAKQAGVPKRVAPHQLRHSLACEMAREGHPIIYVSRQLGHSNVGTTATYLAGISNEEVVKAVAGRLAPGALADVDASSTLQPQLTGASA